jgi:hypothetical protein
MPVGVLTQTILSDGQLARACSSVVYWSARRAEGAPTLDAAGPEAEDGCHHGNREPDWEAGAVAGAGAGAGAKPPEGDAEAERLARHWDKNCGQVWPPVVPAALASFHWLAHCLMTLWAPEGAAAFDAGAEAGADGCNHGIREPD